MRNQYDDDGESSVFMRREPCPECGSRDNLARYSDGHAYCFGCQHREKGEDMSDTDEQDTGWSVSSATPRKQALIQGREFKPLTAREINRDTCERFGYHVARHKGKWVQVADYRDAETHHVVAQHTRDADKNFKWVGDAKAIQPLWGMHLWRDAGKRVVITEGEIDAMSVSQAQGNKWPVVSIPSGAVSAKKYIKRALEWLDKFEEVVFMFDMDEPGIEAAKECAELLRPGQAKIAQLQLKDANDVLCERGPAELIDATWSAKVFRPDGIVQGTDMWEKLTEVQAFGKSCASPWPKLDKYTLGMRKGELITLCSGSGMGKSTAAKEMAHWLLVEQRMTVGYVALEESTQRTAIGLMALEADKPYHLDLRHYEELTDEEKEERKITFDKTVGSGRCYLYDHWGSTETENLLARLRYLARGCDCDWIVLDHLSIIVSGLAEGEERRIIDNLMTALRTLVEETGVGMILISHLKRPEGKGHEEGAATHLSQLRGSASIGQLSDIAIGFERDQQGKQPNLTTVRVLKNRFCGLTGVACYLDYDHETGRMHQSDGPEEDCPFETEDEGF